MKFYKVVYSQKAYSDLKRIWCYIAKEMCEPVIAGNLVSKLENAIDSLGTLPLRHQPYDLSSKTREERRQFVINGYIIIYDVDDKTDVVYIIRIISCKRNKTKVSTN